MTKTTNTIAINDVLIQLGVQIENAGTSTGSQWFSTSEFIASHSPVDGALIGKVSITSPEDYSKVMDAATSAFVQWRVMPAPQRGEIVRQFGEELRRLKEPLGRLVSYEMGKSLQPLSDQDKQEDLLVQGCQSKVWLKAEKQGDAVKFWADADAIIAKGIVAMLIDVFDEQPAAEIAQAELGFIEEIGLKDHLSPTRANGLMSMIKQMKIYALAFA